MAKLKNKLRHYRFKHEKNQKEFAAFLGIGQSLYNKFENNTRQPMLETAWDVAKKLGVSIEDLFEEVSEE